MEPLAIAAIAVGLLAVLAGVGWWAYARSQKRSGATETEADSLREAAERDEKMHEILSAPVPRGDDLRARMRARLDRSRLWMRNHSGW